MPQTSSLLALWLPVKIVRLQEKRYQSNRWLGPAVRCAVLAEVPERACKSGNPSSQVNRVLQLGVIFGYTKDASQERGRAAWQEDEDDEWPSIESLQ